MCYSLWYNTPTMLLATGLQHRGCIIPQSSAPEDGQNNYPKHVELTGIINKPLLLHLVGCLHIHINGTRPSKYQKMKCICCLNI